VPWKLVLTGMLTRRSDQRLEDFQVAALLGTRAFDAPWSPPDGEATTRLGAVGPGDQTAMMPGVVGVGAIGDETRVIKPTRTITETKKRPKATSRVWAAAVVVAVLGIGSFFIFGSSPRNPPPVTTTKPPVTTTTVLAGTAALNALTSQVLAGETAGNVDNASGQAIMQQARFAQADYTSGKTKQAANDLELADSAIANGITNGTIGPTEGQLLQGDLALLAGTLNLSSAVAPPTTTSTTSTTTTTLPSFGNGNGNGNGNDNGNGNGNG
jgi:hypothetical protein